MSPEQRAEHWRKLALEPPGEPTLEGLTEIQLKIPNASPGEVADLLSLAEVLCCDTDSFQQSEKSPNVFTVCNSSLLFIFSSYYG